ncbi:MAG: OmpA family protein [Bacteroidales bacterium]|nr:OmpA family protein [Bacteroidales bacterium]
MKKHIFTLALTIIFCVFLTEPLVAQQELRSQRGRINRLTNIANEAFESGYYFKAFGYYDRAFHREAEGPFRMHLRERLGETQRRLNNPVEAVVYFRAVWDNGNREIGFLTSYSDALLRTANYQKAEVLYEILLKQDTANVLLQNRLASARFGLAQSDTLPVIIAGEIQRQDRIATSFSQRGMTIVEDRLIFSSSQRVSPAKTDLRTGHGFSHLWQATLCQDSLLWQNPMPLSSNIWNADVNDGALSWDPVNRIGYFQRCNDGNCEIFTTSFRNGVWSIPQRFHINGIGATNMVKHPAISPDGRRLIFAAKAAEGYGGSDLWMTTRVDTPTRGSGQTEEPIITNPDWDVPVNLGNLINTPGDEVFPVWINDETIAFSSNGHVGFGGLDIYVAFADRYGNFTRVQHLGAPINSSFDDHTLVISPDIDRIFFTSSRYLGFGHSEAIYSFPKTARILDFLFGEEPDFPLADVGRDETPGLIAHRTFPIEDAEIDLTPQRHPIDQPLFIEASDDRQTLRFTDEAGNVTYFDLAPNTRVQITLQDFVSGDIAFLPSHINQSDVVRTVITQDYVIFERFPKLSEIGEEVFVNNIFFDFDRYDIIRDGHRELDRMVVIAANNPHLLFEIVTHADERGSFQYNLALTQRRMNSILNYLRRQGFDESRLTTRAASHSEPLIRNAQTEAEHALNRRATIRLIDPNRVNNLGEDYEVHENCPLNREGLWFRVQIAAFRQAPEFPLYLFSDFMNAAPEVELTYFLDHDGLFKFTMGDFQDINEARRLNQRILDAGRESYVVAFIDGQRITIAEALAIQRRWARGN